ncbi:MAG: hypothetical protein HDS45_00620 [Bacteroides sp.]|nr:hypothetical protein [Bacteroides sp.]
MNPNGSAPANSARASEAMLSPYPPAIPHPTYLTPTLIKYNKKFRENSANSATEGYGATAPSRFRANKKSL